VTHATTLRARCTKVVHDVGSAEPRSKVEPSSRSITLHQVELGSADPIQLNSHGYTMGRGRLWLVRPRSACRPTTV